MPHTRRGHTVIALRLAGCACILAFSVMWCIRYATSLTSRLCAVERAARFVALVRREIEYYETEFPAIVRKFIASEKLEAHTSSALNENEVADTVCAPLDSADAERFAAFFWQIGAGFSDAELRLCDETSLYFAERLAALRADFAKRRRVNSSLALFAAISVCILIL